MTWRDRAACAGHPTDWWFSDLDAGRSYDQRAIELCEQCPVRAECLDDALRVEGGRYAAFGLRGGLTPEQRHTRRRRTA